MSKPINYYDNDDEDIKDAIKAILNLNVSSQLKFGEIKKLISAAPIDEKIYEKLLEIFRSHIFRRPKYSEKLEPEKWKKYIYLYLMAFHIATLKIKKLDYQNKLTFYKKKASDYLLTETEIDGSVPQAVSSEKETLLSARLANQTSAQAVAQAKLQAIASKGLGNSNSIPSGKSEEFYNKLRNCIEDKLNPDYLPAAGSKNTSYSLSVNNLCLQLSAQITQLINNAHIQTEINEINQRLDTIEEALTKQGSTTFELIFEWIFILIVPGFMGGAIGRISSNLKIVSRINTKFEKITARIDLTRVFEDGIKDASKQAFRNLVRLHRDGSVNAKKQLTINVFNKNMQLSQMLHTMLIVPLKIVGCLGLFDYYDEKNLKDRYALYNNLHGKLLNPAYNQILVNVFVNEYKKIYLQECLFGINTPYLCKLEVFNDRTVMTSCIPKIGIEDDDITYLSKFNPYFNDLLKGLGNPNPFVNGIQYGHGNKIIGHGRYLLDTEYFSAGVDRQDLLHGYWEGTLALELVQISNNINEVIFALNWKLNVYNTKSRSTIKHAIDKYYYLTIVSPLLGEHYVKRYSRLVKKVPVDNLLTFNDEITEFRNQKQVLEDIFG